MAAVNLAKGLLREQGVVFTEEQTSNEAMEENGYDNPAADFPDDSDAGEKMHTSINIEDEEPIPWREVPEQVWLRIINHRNAVTKKGTVKIVTLQKREGSLLYAWTSPYITRCIDLSIRNRANKELIQDATHLYIMSLGKEPCAADSTKSFFNIQLKHF